MPTIVWAFVVYRGLRIKITFSESSIFPICCWLPLANRWLTEPDTRILHGQISNAFDHRRSSATKQSTCGLAWAVNQIDRAAAMATWSRRYNAEGLYCRALSRIIHLGERYWPCNWSVSIVDGDQTSPITACWYFVNLRASLSLSVGIKCCLGVSACMRVTVWETCGDVKAFNQQCTLTFCHYATRPPLLETDIFPFHIFPRTFPSDISPPFLQDSGHSISSMSSARRRIMTDSLFVSSFCTKGGERLRRNCTRWNFRGFVQRDVLHSSQPLAFTRTADNTYQSINQSVNF